MLGLSTQDTFTITGSGQKISLLIFVFFSLFSYRQFARKNLRLILNLPQLKLSRDKRLHLALQWHSDFLGNLRRLVITKIRIC